MSYSNCTRRRINCPTMTSTYRLTSSTRTPARANLLTTLLEALSQHPEGLTLVPRDDEAVLVYFLPSLHPIC